MVIFLTVQFKYSVEQSKILSALNNIYAFLSHTSSSTQRGKKRYLDTQGQLEQCWQQLERMRRSEQRLRDSELELMAILDNCSTVVYVRDLEGWLTRVNRECEQRFKLSQEQILGKSSNDLFPENIAASYTGNDHKTVVHKTAVITEEEAV